jgi:cytochrome c553
MDSKMRKWIVTILCLAGISGCVRESHEVVHTDATELGKRDGKTLYQSCLLCHSTQEMQRGPVLDGMEAWYVLEQLKKFDQGIRGTNPKNRAEFLMGASMARIQGEPELQAVAEYISTRPAKKHLTTLEGDAERGRELYTKCTACHGEDGRGKPELKAPALHVQEDWFLLDQLRKYKMGLRGGHGSDIYGKVMAESVSQWKDKDLKDVVVYLNGLKSQN